jgi:nucleotide-binding universal stress UspA family protein
MSDNNYPSRQAERISRKWGNRLDEFNLPCPLCRGRLVFQGVGHSHLYEFAEDEPGVVQELDVLPMSFVCDRCGYTAEFDAELFDPAYLAQLQGEDPERVAELSPGDFRVLVPLTGREVSNTLLDLAAAIAYERHGDVIVLNTLPQSGMTDIIEKKLEVFRPLVDRPVPIRLLQERVTDIGESIVAISARQGVSLTLVNWHGWSRNEFALMGKVLTPILDETICDVAVVQDRGLTRVRRVLLLTSGGPNSAAAAPLALDWARAFDAELHLVSVITPEQTEAMGYERIMETLEHLTLRDDERVIRHVWTGEDVVETIVEFATSYDLIVIGAAPRDWRGKIQSDSVTARVARNSGITTIVIRGRQKLFTSWYYAVRSLFQSLFR